MSVTGNTRDSDELVKISCSTDVVSIAFVVENYQWKSLEMLKLPGVKTYVGTFEFFFFKLLVLFEAMPNVKTKSKPMDTNKMNPKWFHGFRLQNIFPNVRAICTGIFGEQLFRGPTANVKTTECPRV